MNPPLPCPWSCLRSASPAGSCSTAGDCFRTCPAFWKARAARFFPMARRKTRALSDYGAIIAQFLPFVVLIVVFYFFLIRPQRKQQKELEKFRNSLKRGDKVVTAGGIYGTVDEIKDRTVLIKVDGEVKLRVDKNSLVRDFTQDAPQQ